jgi:hypothetical protein
MYRTKALALLVATALAGAASAAVAATGPSSSQSPYIVPTAPGWEVTSILTVGDYPGGPGLPASSYNMVGIPDGLGALNGTFNESTGEFLSGGSAFTVFMNHELGPTVGAVRAHGATGAFVSQWTIDKNTLQVTAGKDLINTVFTWDSGGGYVNTTGSTSFARFCSADLPALTAFYNSATGKGYNGYIFMNGEETGAEGRAFGTFVSGGNKGKAYELPYLGKFSWENSIANPGSGDKTIVAGTDDSRPGQVYVYVGTKSAAGSDIQKAGLEGGSLYGVKVTGVTSETGAINGTFTLAAPDGTGGYVVGVSGADLQSKSVTAGITEFARPEDGAWDPSNPNVFYFATTGNAGQPARLYKLTFTDLANPEAGGAIEMVVESSTLTGTDGEAARSFDNITVSADGKVYVQEDPGGSPYLAKTWVIDPTKSLGDAGFAVQAFSSDPDRFGAGAPMLLTVDEENSGIIEVTSIVQDASWYEPGRRYFLGVMQAHYDIPGSLVEGGQLYLMAAPVPEPSTYALMAAGLVGVGIAVRRRKLLKDR